MPFSHKNMYPFWTPPNYSALIVVVIEFLFLLINYNFFLEVQKYSKWSRHFNTHWEREIVYDPEHNKFLLDTFPFCLIFQKKIFFNRFFFHLVDYYLFIYFNSKHTQHKTCQRFHQILNQRVNGGMRPQ